MSAPLLAQRRARTIVWGWKWGAGGWPGVEREVELGSSVKEGEVGGVIGIGIGIGIGIQRSWSRSVSVSECV
eukprot:1306741-Rhodomonas_salina.1